MQASDDVLLAIFCLEYSIYLNNYTGTVRFELTTFGKSSYFLDKCHKPDSTKYPYYILLINKNRNLRLLAVLPPPITDRHHHSPPFLSAPVLGMGGESRIGGLLPPKG